MSRFDESEQLVGERHDAGVGKPCAREQPVVFDLDRWHGADGSGDIVLPQEDGIAAKGGQIPAGRVQNVTEAIDRAIGRNERRFARHVVDGGFGWGYVVVGAALNDATGVLEIGRRRKQSSDREQFRRAVRGAHSSIERPRCFIDDPETPESVRNPVDAIARLEHGAGILGARLFPLGSVEKEQPRAIVEARLTSVGEPAADGRWCDVQLTCDGAATDAAIGQRSH